ncbi:MAG: L-lactate dehydrogenase [Kiritimatiellae bacterium]|jgi:L-lactate dehydrogenase|nr:L-lactate dehydrogenase [Kiritimatiellia bacterium]NLD90459.1 L-lactate dehydrogenase [Lentisphaerota bacterium]HPC20228.1 L-lactate dehydrogenase [Kiritimatiellia bacterium]HQN80386.1 L-lactate dehydrogenase [Kiritimatiellia bacterium]HQQ61169.1 L-lactate dehydrogenase [Kiritimatiellia bacterium]
MTNLISRKVVIVGAGAVGSGFAFALAQAGIAEEIALVDVNADLAKGQALDLAHGAPFYRPVHIHADTAPTAYRNAAVVVVTAGKAQAGPDQSRLDLMQINARIVTSIIADIQAVNPNAIVLVATNPVDIVTHVARIRTHWPRGRILGSGTVLDSARFRWLLAEHCGISPQNVHASILGEHGDSEFAAWSLVHVGGLPMNDYCSICRKCDFLQRRPQIVEQVRRSAYHIIGYKGSTSFGVAMAMTQIVRAILRNERRVMTVSAALTGEYGLNDVTLGVPCVLDANGIAEVIEAPLTASEQQELERSAQILKDGLARLE